MSDKFRVTALTPQRAEAATGSVAGVAPYLKRMLCAPCAECGRRRNDPGPQGAPSLMQRY